MTITLWLRGPARLTIPPATLAVFAARVGPGPWGRTFDRAVLAGRVRYWYETWALATGRLLYDPTRPARVTVTVLQEAPHERP